MIFLYICVDKLLYRYMYMYIMYKMKKKNDIKYFLWKIFWKFLGLLLDILIFIF